jgi:hypothetical protein
MTEGRMGLWLRQTEDIRIHVWHRYSVTVNQVMVETLKLQLMQMHFLFSASIKFTLKYKYISTIFNLFVCIYICISVFIFFFINSRISMQYNYILIICLNFVNQVALGGIIRAVGHQTFGAIITLLGYYVICLPLGILLTLYTSLRSEGTLTCIR